MLFLTRWTDLCDTIHNSADFYCANANPHLLSLAPYMASSARLINATALEPSFWKTEIPILAGCRLSRSMPGGSFDREPPGSTPPVAQSAPRSQSSLFIFYGVAYSSFIDSSCIQRMTATAV